jgi:hypothetical protein
MKRTLLAGAALGALLLVPLVAQADEIVTFAQTSQSNDVTITASGGTSTTLSAVNIPVGISELFGGAPETANFSLSATSVGAATMLGADIVQHFNGSFSLLVGAVNVLSATFTDLAIGAGAGLGVQSEDPPDTITFTSAVIPASEFGLPSAISLALTNVLPSLFIDGTTLGSGTASISGDVSATPLATPEPATLAVLGVAMAGLGYARRQRRAV